jgi:hypothetical protein
VKGWSVDSPQTKAYLVWDTGSWDKSVISKEHTRDIQQYKKEISLRCYGHEDKLKGRSRIRYMHFFYVVKCRPISRPRPKHAQATIERVLQELFYMRSTPCPLLSNGSLNIFPQKQTRGRMRDLLLGNSAEIRLRQQCGLCFSWVRAKWI